MANTMQEWADVEWTTILWPLPSDLGQRRKLIAHELFHRVQTEIGHPAVSPGLPHLDTRTGRTWLRLEFRALAQAMSSGEQQRATAVSDALLFRAMRRTLWVGSAVREDALEVNEGLAEYTGWRCSGLAQEHQLRGVASRLRGEDSNLFHQRSFAYASGPAYALLIDMRTNDGHDRAWRQEIAQGKQLTGITAELWSPEPPQDLKEQAFARAAVYGLAEIDREESVLEEQRATRISSDRMLLVTGPILQLPMSANAHYTYDPNRVETLPQHGQVYASLRVVDSWGELRVEGGRALMRRAAQDTPEGVSVTAPKNGELTGPGWELTLNDGWSLEVSERAGDWRVARER